MRRVALSVPLALALLVLSGPRCDMAKPKGWLGVTWGENADDAIGRLHLDCKDWMAWVGGGGYEVCADLDHPVQVYGIGSNQVRVIRKDGKLAGLEAIFLDCAAKAEPLRKGLIKEFGLEDNAAPYHRWADGEIARLQRNSDGSCRLTVTDAAFGKAYADWLIREGLQELRL